ncbi:MAG: hypothetical protein ACTHOR_18430, partial [Devosia sp.]
GAGVGALGSQLRQLSGQPGGAGFGDAFSALEELEQARQELGRQQQGALGTAGEIVGGIGAGGLATSLAPSFGLKALLPSVAEGAAYGFGSANGDLQNRGWGALTGGLVAGGIGAVAAGVGRAMNAGERAAATRAGLASQVAGAPSTAAIRAEAKAAYKLADTSGAVMSPSVTSLFSQDLKAMAQADGMILPDGALADGYSRLGNALKFADAFAGKPMTMPEFQTLHRMVQKVAQSGQGDESALGAHMLDHIESTFGQLPKSAFLTGDGQRAVTAWTEGQNIWARYKRTQFIDQALNNAGLAKGGFAAGLRSELASILKNPDQARYFPAAQQQAMRDFVKGGSVQNVLFQFTNSSPLAVEILGHMAGGPGGAVGAAAARFGLRQMQRARLDAAAEGLGGQVRASVALPNGWRPPVLPPALSPQAQMYLRQAGAVGAQQLPQLPDPRGIIPAGAFQ